MLSARFLGEVMPHTGLVYLPLDPWVDYTYLRLDWYSFDTVGIMSQSGLIPLPLGQRMERRLNPK